MTRKERLTDRTCALIERDRVVALKRWDGWYLGQHTNIAASEDAAVWSWRPHALLFDDLEMAFAVARVLDCKVVSYRVKRGP